METSRTVSLKMNFSEQGCGGFCPPQGARVTLEVHSSDVAEEMDAVVLRGDRDGLYALASAILATAETTVNGYHLHIDEAADGPVYHSPQGYTLTIDRFEK